MSRRGRGRNSINPFFGGFRSSRIDNDDNNNSSSDDSDHNQGGGSSDDHRPAYRGRRQIRNIRSNMNIFDPPVVIQAEPTPKKKPISTDLLLYGKDIHASSANDSMDVDNSDEDDERRASTNESSLERFQRLMLTDQGPENCFGCKHVGEFAPGIALTNLQALMVRLQDFDTSHIDQHCIDVSNMYEKLIRQPANKSIDRNHGITPNTKKLPPWNPATIKSHLYYHNNEPKTGIKLLMHSTKFLAMYISKNLIMEQSPDDGSISINPVSIKAFKELTDTYIKLGKVNPRSMGTFASTTGDLMKQVNKMAILDPTKKTIQTGNMGQSLDYYFHSQVLSLRQDIIQQTQIESTHAENDQATDSVTPGIRGSVDIF